MEALPWNGRLACPAGGKVGGPLRVAKAEGPLPCIHPRGHAILCEFCLCAFCGGLLTPFAPRVGVRGLAHFVRSACWVAWASSLRSLRVRGCLGLLTSFAPRAGLWGLAHSVRSACGAVWGLLTPFAPRAGLLGLAHSVRSACGVAWASSLRSLRVLGCVG